MHREEEFEKISALYYQNLTMKREICEIEMQRLEYNVSWI